MKNAPYLVVPQAGDPHGYFLINWKKGLKLYVKKVFENQAQTAFNYQFFYLDSKGRAVRRADHKAFSYKKNVTRMDITSAATWFLTRYFSYRELHYSFPEYDRSRTGGHYPVLGRHPSKNIFELVWD